MDIRTRVLSVLNQQQPDRVPWLGDLDYWIQYLQAADKMPDQYQAKDGIYRLHRDLGVGFYLQGFYPFRLVYDGIEVIEEPVGRGKVRRVITPFGELREFQRWIDESYCIAWSERFVKSWRDLKPLRYLFEHTYYEPYYELAQKRYDLVGDNGVVLCYLPRSPLMEMVAILSNIQNVAFMQCDATDEFEETILWGGIPGVYFTDLVSDEKFDQFVIRVLEVMRTEPRYVLGVADQVPPLARFERIARVRPLVEEYGRYEN